MQVCFSTLLLSHLIFLEKESTPQGVQSNACLKQTEPMPSQKGYQAIYLIMSVSEQENWSIKGKKKRGLQRGKKLQKRKKEKIATGQASAGS